MEFDVQKIFLGAFVALACNATAAPAQDFYRGKTVNLIVGNATGGGYDAYARLLARHMPKYIPGEPTFVVRNMPGAGGMAMSNFLYSQAARDGLTIGMMSRANPIEPVLGNPAAKFKSEDFTWLGTSSSYEDDAYCLVIRPVAPRVPGQSRRGDRCARLGQLRRQLGGRPRGPATPEPRGLGHRALRRPDDGEPLLRSLLRLGPRGRRDPSGAAVQGSARR